MASHLTVTAKAPSGASTTKAFNAQGGAEAEGGALGAFAAMLGGTQQAQEPKAAPGSRLEAALDKLANLVLGGAEAGDTDSEPADPEAVAVAIDATLPIAVQTEAKALLTGLVKDLATLKQSLEAGEAADPELLKRIDAALDSLSAQLDIDLAALASPSLDDLAAITPATDAGDLATTTRLSQALAPLAAALLGGDAGATDAAPETTRLLATVGDKLARLAKALDGNAADPVELAALNQKAGGPADADLDAALRKLLAAAPALSAGAAEPKLATPQLSLSETTLTGKPADAAVTSTASIDNGDSADGTPALKADVKADTGTDNQEGDARPRSDDDRNASDSKPAAAIAGSVGEIRDDSRSAAQAAAQPARVDIAAPRVIQAGYQTSQQQLNLPQLAFELVRQVNDGNTRFQMRLDPPELGRIDVKLDIDNTGQINARLVVEKSETLDLMQRDQRALERALQQAGLDSSKTNLEFSLKQNPFSGGQQGRDDSGQQFSLSGTATGDVEEAPPPTINLYRASLTASGVNIIA